MAILTSNFNDLKSQAYINNNANIKLKAITSFLIIVYVKFKLKL